MQKKYMSKACKAAEKERVKMGLREDDPVYYKVQLQKLLDKARKNGIKPDFSIYDGPKERTIKVLFRNEIGECAGATIVKRRK